MAGLALIASSQESTFGFPNVLRIRQHIAEVSSFKFGDACPFDLVSHPPGKPLDAAGDDPVLVAFQAATRSYLPVSGSQYGNLRIVFFGVAAGRSVVRSRCSLSSERHTDHVDTWQSRRRSLP